VIRTSERGWFAALVKAYKEEARTCFVDDAETGFDHILVARGGVTGRRRARPQASVLELTDCCAGLRGASRAARAEAQRHGPGDASH
jgi:crotonobetainyl-CoA:carnitine CoA-transferase CaiB-like acyl-CoA transferase